MNHPQISPIYTDEKRTPKPAGALSGYLRESANSAHKKKLHAALAAMVLGIAATITAADNWPQFRGPRSDGLSEGKNLPDSWSATENIAWKIATPGLGWSSPIVWDGKIFLTSAARIAGDEPPQMGLYLGKSRGEGEHRFLVLGYDLATGAKLWEQEVHRGVPARAIHLKNSFASATPVTDGRRVVALFHDVGLFAFDLDGKPLWNVPVPPTKTRADFGHGGSPVLHDGKVYLVDDNESASFLAAFDAATGKELWRVPRETETNYATPFVWQSGKRTELIVPATRRTISYDLEGKELWSYRGGMSKLTIGTPFAAHDLLYVGSGYFQDGVRGLFAIKPGASGDITPDFSSGAGEAFAWFNMKAAPYNPTPLVYGDHLYVLYDHGMLSCYDARTGRPFYEKQRLDTPGGFTASPWAHDGKIFCLSERAETVVVPAGPEFKVIARHALEPEPCLATPALVGDSVLIRTASKLYRIRNPKSASR
ncbi:MAG TPA: PQQ-binding-like beta-propeller repeat protein [Verrucomicrobiaceae bacterium]|jgi:outer membrane protein assembly factor BamB